MTIKLSDDMMIWSKGWDAAVAGQLRVPPASIPKNWQPFWFEGFDEAAAEVKSSSEGNKFADANDDAYTITDGLGNIIKP